MLDRAVDQFPRRRLEDQLRGQRQMLVATPAMPRPPWLLTPEAPVRALLRVRDGVYTVVCLQGEPLGQRGALAHRQRDHRLGDALLMPKAVPAATAAACQGEDVDGIVGHAPLDNHSGCLYPVPGTYAITECLLLGSGSIW